MRDERLSEILKKKELKNFWYCFEYLLLAGYPENEAIGHSLNEFKESSIFTDVAFIGMHKVQKDIIIRLDDIDRVCRQSVLKVGFYNEDTIKLDGMYDTYRKWLMIDKYARWNAEIEDPCIKIRFNNLSHYTLTYFLSLSKKYYGFDAFNILKPEENVLINLLPPPELLLSSEEIKQKMMKMVGIPVHLFRQNNTRLI